MIQLNKLKIYEKFKGKLKKVLEGKYIIQNYQIPHTDFKTKLILKQTCSTSMYQSTSKR
jgi:hypothetical protein